MSRFTVAGLGLMAEGMRRLQLRAWIWLLVAGFRCRTRKVYKSAPWVSTSSRAGGSYTAVRIPCRCFSLYRAFRPLCLCLTPRSSINNHKSLICKNVRSFDFYECHFNTQESIVDFRRQLEAPKCLGRHNFSTKPLAERRLHNRLHANGATSEMWRISRPAGRLCCCCCCCGLRCLEMQDRLKPEPKAQKPN